MRYYYFGCSVDNDIIVFKIKKILKKNHNILELWNKDILLERKYDSVPGSSVDVDGEVVEAGDRGRELTRLQAHTLPQVHVQLNGEHVKIGPAKDLASQLPLPPMVMLSFSLIFGNYFLA